MEVNMIKAIYVKPTANRILDGEKLNIFSKIRKEASMHSGDTLTVLKSHCKHSNKNMSFSKSWLLPPTVCQVPELRVEASPPRAASLGKYSP